MYKYQTIKLTEIMKESFEYLIGHLILNNDVDVIPPRHFLILS